MTSSQKELVKEHTHILRVMLSVDDCIAFWNANSDELSRDERVQAAFSGHWFGAKSEMRVRTLLSDMALRFDEFPSALAAIRIWNPPREIAPWICHFHTQLIDPVYRKFTGDLLPTRTLQGYATIDREVVARWVQEQWPGRWSPATCMKFGGNMLATALEAGLLKERRDPRKHLQPRAPRLAVEYLLYLLRETSIKGTILESQYLRCLAHSREDLSDLFRKLESVKLSALGEIQHFDWLYPNLISWAEAQAKQNPKVRSA